MTQLPYLNLGCGRVILPAPRPEHYGLIDPITDYALWHNVDRNPEPGVDETLDIFRYPFPWADNSFDGALCAHICEHIPHEIRVNPVRQPSDAEVEAYRSRMDVLMPSMKRNDPLRSFEANFLYREVTPRTRELQSLQDGWYAFFAELHRVLTPGSIIHVLSPYAWSNGGVTDPTHCRLLTENSFSHSMTPDPDAPFKYATGGLHLELAEPVRLAPTPLFAHLFHDRAAWEDALQTRINVVHELYVKLRVVK